MSIYKSITDVNFSNVAEYEGMFSHDIGSGVKIINESLISSYEVAVERAKVELIKEAYDERVINITTIYVENLKINDVIEFKGVLWIVKDITITFKNPVLNYLIKGVRYE